MVSTANRGAISILSTSSTLDSGRSSWTLAELGWLGRLGESSRVKVGCPVSTNEAISNKRDWPFNKNFKNNQFCTLLSGSASENTASFAPKCQCLATQSGVLGCST